MRPSKDFPVSLDDTRQRSDKRCFYCPSHLGEPHQEDCVCRQRTVVVDVTIQCTITVPDNWKPDDIEWHYNEYTHATNIYSKLEHYIKRHDDLCWGITVPTGTPGVALSRAQGYDASRLKVAFVREATEVDEAYDGIFAGVLESDNASL